MEDEKFTQPANEGDEVEGHKFIQDEANPPEKFVESPPDEDDEVEAHKV